MKNAFITISAIAPTIEISPTAQAQRDKLLTQAATVDRVDSNEAAAYASDILKDIKQMTRFVELGRTEAKAPLLDYGRQVDAIAKELTGELDAVAKDLALKIGVWTGEQQRLARIAAQKAQEEATRLIAEKRAAERALQEKQQAELAALEAQAAKASGPEAIALAMEQEQRLREQEFAQQQRDEETQAQVVAIKAAALEVVGPRPAGIATRNVLRFEVTDIRALYAAAPHCVKMEAVAGVLQATLKNLPAGASLPGVRHWVEAVAIVR